MDTAYFGRDDYFVLENTGVREALFAFGTRETSVFRLSVENHDGWSGEWCTEEHNFCGRLRATGLKAGSFYTARGYTGDREIAALNFRTLAGLAGSPILRFAVIADPHLSLDRENRRGRMFQESSCLLQEIVELAQSEAVDALMLPGDLTDAGKPEEFRKVMEILSAFSGFLFTIPGDHDSGCKSHSLKDTPGGDWLSAVPYVKQLGNLRVLGLDTSPGILGKPQMELLEQTLADPGRLIILSHHNLIPNSHIRDKDAVVDDHQYVRDLLMESRTCWVAYCGHKNVPWMLRAGRGVQINVPQPVHYPAGFLSVAVYKDALIHQFVPIRSEILRDYSLRMLSCDGSPFFDPEYRYGSLEARSSILSWEEN
jgi:hypothetical protein